MTYYSELTRSSTYLLGCRWVNKTWGFPFILLLQKVMNYVMKVMNIGKFPQKYPQRSQLGNTNLSTLQKQTPPRMISWGPEIFRAV